MLFEMLLADLAVRVCHFECLYCFFFGALQCVEWRNSEGAYAGLLGRIHREDYAGNEVTGWEEGW